MNHGESSRPERESPRLLLLGQAQSQTAPSWELNAVSQATTVPTTAGPTA